MTADLNESIRPRKLAHVVLRTNERFEEMCQWYRDVLNAWDVHKAPMICFMTYDEEHHRLAMKKVPGVTDRPSGTVGLEHIAFTYASLGDLLTTYGRLKEAGIKPLICVNHGVTMSLYYQDPDRNRVELQADSFESSSEANDLMASEAFSLNPIGVMFDPDDLLERHRAGVPDDELRVWPDPPQPVDPAIMKTLSAN